jgi:hypothetical protein
MQDGRDGVRSRQYARPADDGYTNVPARRSRADEQRQGRGGQQQTWDSWDDEPAGQFERQESTWAPAWRRDQPATPEWSDHETPSRRGRPRGDQKVRQTSRGGRFATLGHRSIEVGKRTGSLGQTGYQWALTQKQRILSTRRGRVIVVVVAVCLLLGSLGSVGLAYAQYSHVKSEATSALANLKSAETSLKALQSNPFDTATISQAQAQLGLAHADFVQMNNTLQTIPGVFAVTPIVGSKLDAAFKVGPIAVEATQAGVLGCEILGILAPKLKNPLSTNVPGLTSADMTSIQSKFNTLYSLVATLLEQVQNLPPSAASLDPRLGPLLATITTHLPEFTQGLTDAKNLMAVLPQLLGVGKPANYLLEVLDSTELRPGGGFIGNFGALTFLNGRMQGKPQIKDVDLLDNHDCSLGLAIPTELNWFTSGCKNTLLFQDSNLDADFPSNAERSIQMYNYAGGSSLLSNSQGPIKTFQGVIAITPWLIENALALTGPITLPQYGNVKITSQNMIQKIHYFQLYPGLGGADTVIDPACGSSYRKAFTCYLFKAFLQQLGVASSKNFGQLGKLLIDSIHTKDIQIYLSSPGAEAALVHRDLASTINSPKSGDGLMVVDANVDGLKANNYINYTWHDQISLDSSGNATHHLALTYDYPATSDAINNSYPSQSANKGCPTIICYQDYLRIYIPASSTHILKPGNLGTLGSAPLQTSGFGMTVIEGEVYLPIGSGTFTLSLSWTVPHAAVSTAGGWSYQYVVEKQAGITWPMNVALTLPSCARVLGSLQGFTTPTAQSAVVKEPLAEDVNLSLQYTCY